MAPDASPPSDLICHCCKRDREKKDESPRLLTKMPDEIVQCVKFKRKSIPLYLCSHCDELSLAAAMTAHFKRTADE